MGNTSEDTKKLRGQITTKENDEESRVNFTVYKRYLNYVGGLKQFTLTNITLICFIALKVLGDYLVGAWAVSSDQHTRFGYYCGVYFNILIFQSLMVFLRVHVLTYYSFNGTKKLHSDMVDRVM